MEKDLRGMFYEEIEEAVKVLGAEKYRASQVFSWVHAKAVRSFEEMANLPAELKEKLASSCAITLFKITDISESALDGTKKMLFEFEGGAYAECVLLFAQKRITLCISSQSGCACDCAFCSTARLGFRRNLTAGEIVTEFLEAEREAGAKIDNVVFMGMGEPLLNYENVIRAVEILAIPKGRGLSQSRVTVSTVGIIPLIRRIADENRQFNLAISLITANPKLRARLVPLDEKYPMEEIIDAAGYYNKKTGREIFFEYILFGGLNDAEDDAYELLRLVNRIKCKINLIPYNPGDSSGFKKPDNDRVNAFHKILVDAGFMTFVRREKGADIAAACGQLALKKKEKLGENEKLTGNS